MVDEQGTERSRKRQQQRELETIFGTVQVRRTGYGAEGQASLHPLDAQLNLPAERYSLEVRRRAALEAAKNSFDETVQTLSEYTGAQIGKRQVEELVSRAAQDFDAFYEQRQQQPAEDQQAEEQPAEDQQTATGDAPADALLVISSDGKGVVMHQQDLRPATRKASAGKRNKLATRLSKGEKRNRKRMATVAAVYSVAPRVRTPEQMLAVLARAQDAEQQRWSRPRPQHKRVWASLEQEPRQVLQEAFREALDRDPQRTRTWVAVVDGNQTQLHLLEQLAEHHGVQLTIVLDIFHVLGYLWKAGHAVAVEGSKELEQWVLQRLGRVLEGRARLVAAGMRRSATRRRLSARQREPLDRGANYLLKYQNYLAYDRYLAGGLPIGSVIEGACRHLVKDRMWASRVRAGGCPAPRRCCACGRCVPAAISTSTGSSTKHRSGSVPTRSATPTDRYRRCATRRCPTSDSSVS